MSLMPRNALILLWDSCYVRCVRYVCTHYVLVPLPQCSLGSSSTFHVLPINHCVTCKSHDHATRISGYPSLYQSSIFHIVQVRNKEVMFYVSSTYLLVLPLLCCRFDVATAKSYGLVPGPLYGQRKAGVSVTAPDGTVVSLVLLGCLYSYSFR